MDTKILKHGAPARLFPVVPESAKEQKSLSILLATLVSVQPFSATLLRELGVNFGKRSTLSCFTEVTLTNEIKGMKDRPDALMVVKTGSKSWSALIEAKVGKSKVGSDQLERYIELAKANSVDAVITISNELTPDPAICPTPLSKGISKKVDVYHLSWSAILTNAFLLASDDDDPFNNDDEVFLISELIRYLEHPSSGRLPLDQMNSDWPKIVSDVQTGHPLNPKSDTLEEMITLWHQESRDIALIMTRMLQEPVKVGLQRSKLKDPKQWVEQDIKEFCSNKMLDFNLDVPNAASKILVEADFRRRVVRCSMKLGAPTDKKSNSARLNWLLKQLKDSDKSRIIVTCITHGRSQNFGAMAHEIDSGSEEIKELNEIVSFQVEMSADLGKHFNSRKKFVENLELHVPDFYKNVAEKLKPFVPKPPAMPEKRSSKSTDDIVSEGVSSPEQRPEWASVWQRPEIKTEEA